MKMLTEKEILEALKADASSSKKAMARKGMAYYNAEHDILGYKMYYYNADGQLVEDTSRSNSRICHPFFTELVDQLAAYMLSFEENPIQAVPSAEGLQKYLDNYFGDEFWESVQDLITGAAAKGWEWLYAYKNADDHLAFSTVDSLHIIEVDAKKASDNMQHIIYHATEVDKDGKRITRVQVFDKQEIYFYIKEENELKPDPDELINPRPHVVWTDTLTGVKYGHGLGFLPFFRLDNNSRKVTGLKPIKGLIDDYDLMECGLSNNLQDFDHPIYMVKGYEGNDLDQLQQNIRTKKVLGVGEGGGLDILTINIPYEARKLKAAEDEKNIYRFGMGFNSSQVGDGNITNVVIQSRYTLLNLKASKLLKRLKRMLKSILEVVLNEINKVHETDYRLSDVQMHFEFITPVNASEQVENAKMEAETEQLRINNILDAATVIGEEETLRGICEILDLDFDELEARLEDRNEAGNAFTAQSLLTEVV